MAGGIQIPAVSNRGPTPDDAVRVNTHGPQRVRSQGVIRGRFDGGPARAADTSGGEDLAALGRGLSVIAGEWEETVRQRQNIEALKNIQDFRDRERQTLAEVETLDGEDAYQAVAVMENFYKTEGDQLMEMSRGTYQQSRFYQAEVLRSRDAGLNRAYAHQFARMNAAKESVLQGQMAALYEKIQNDPANAPRYEAELDDVLDALNPGLDNTAGKQEFRGRSKDAQRGAVTAQYRDLLETDPGAAAELLGALGPSRAGQLFSPDELQAMKQTLDLSFDNQLVKRSLNRYGQALFTGTPREQAEVMTGITDEISKISDPERRALILRTFRQGMQDAAVTNGANDLKAREDFLATARAENWNPLTMLARAGEIPGMSAAAREILKKNIQTGVVDQETPENLAGYDAIRLAVDEADNAGKPLSDQQVKAMAQQVGATTGQVKGLLTYLEQGGFSQKGLASEVRKRWQAMTGQTGEPPCGLIDEVAQGLPSGKAATPEEIAHVTAVLTLNRM